MKRYGNLWPSFVSWENLLLAARKARRGKRDRPVVRDFDFDLERNLLDLQRELDSGNYRPGKFSTHWITRPKPRLISAAPYRDRVVHHALMNVMEPILDRHFHDHSYACRKGKGTHAAADRLQCLMRRNSHLVQCDIRKYFPSIDHAILKHLFRRKVKDKRTLALMDLIVDSSNDQEPVPDWFPGDTLLAPAERRKGLPIGNLTSQWFANWMLDGLDHLVTAHLGLGGYVRYCDDFILMDNDRDKLRDAVNATRGWLHERRLLLHEERLHIRKSDYPIRFVGYRIARHNRKLPRQNVRDFCRRVRWMQKMYAVGELEIEDIRPRLMSWLGHARHGCCEGFIDQLSNQWIFQRAGTEYEPRSSWRELEQQREELPFGVPDQRRSGLPGQPRRLPACPALRDAFRMRHAREFRRLRTAKERV